MDADYLVRDDKPVIRLFYKGVDGRVVKEVTDFQPYFYAVPVDAGKLTDELKKFGKVVKVEKKRMIDIREEIDALKITVKQPRDVPELRGEVKNLEYCREVREADIPFAHRYLIDAGLTPMEGCEAVGLNIAAFDLEVYNPRGEPDSGKDPIIMISYADNLGLKRVWTYRSNDAKPGYVEVLSNELEIIKKLMETIKEQSIDLITSYNGDNFDFPYLKDRADKHKLKLDIGLEGSLVRLERRGMNTGARVRGRPHVDMYPISRQVFNISRYRLEDVYMELFGTELVDIKPTDMARIWDSPKSDEFNKFLEYSMSDAASTLRIAESLLPLQYELSRIVGQPVYECSRAGSGQRAETMFVRKAHEKDILVPNKPSDRIAEERQGSSYTGAYVVEPKRGIHDNIILFDFRSLYPSILVSHNIDPSTIDCTCCPDDINKSPEGHHFCEKKEGFIPGVLNELILKRIEIKNKLRKETDPEKKRVLNVEQQAIKILANSMYGYYAFARARWYSKDCAEAIAAFGREYIHKTIKSAGEHGFEIIYGDTDSVYLTLPGVKDTSEIIKDARIFSEKINEELPEAMELEFEGFYPRGIFITKKRYALIDEKGKLSVKGLETRRRDWANVAKTTQVDVLNAILLDKDPGKAVEIVKGVVHNIKSGGVSLRDLAINTQITRGLGEYVNKGPHVLAAEKAIREGMDFGRGNMVTYIVTKRGSSISDKARVIDFVEEGDYDADYYINNQVIPAVLRILDALGYSEDELKGLGKQMTLDGF